MFIQMQNSKDISCSKAKNEGTKLSQAKQALDGLDLEV